jgi:hypothetical protein
MQVWTFHDKLNVHAGLPEEAKESGMSVLSLTPGCPFCQDKTVTWFWRLREIFDGQKTKGDRLPLENMLEGLISQASQPNEYRVIHWSEISHTSFCLANNEPFVNEFFSRAGVTTADSSSSPATFNCFSVSADAADL